MDFSSLALLSRTIADELRGAELGHASSFPYIRNPRPQETDKKDLTLQVIVIGGSIFKKGIFKRVNGALHLVSSSQKSQPPFRTKEDFLRFCLAEVDPSIPDIGVNFAYPLRPFLRQGRLDGKLLSGMKENRFEGLTTEAIGEELERAIYEKNGKRMKITTANDTVCLLFSGLSVTDWQNLTAGVIGTGINFAFFSDAHEAINTEAANFNKFSQSDEAKQIDRDSVSPGSALFEKEIAGAYLYQHFNQYVKARGLSFSPLTQTHELDILAQEETEEGQLARSLLRRSAQLSGALIAGVTLFKGQDATCVLEGSLFWKGYRYKEVVDETVSSLLSDQAVTFIKIADSPLLGAAYLVG